MDRRTFLKSGAAAVALASLPAIAQTDLPEIIPAAPSESEFFTTGLKTLDESLGGGVMRGEIFAIVGMMNVGKSYFLKQALRLNEDRNVLHMSLNFLLDGELRNFVADRIIEKQPEILLLDGISPNMVEKPKLTNSLVQIERIRDAINPAILFAINVKSPGWNRLKMTIDLNQVTGSWMIYNHWYPGAKGKRLYELRHSSHRPTGNYSDDFPRSWPTNHYFPYRVLTDVERSDVRHVMEEINREYSASDANFQDSFDSICSLMEQQQSDRSLYLLYREFLEHRVRELKMLLA